MGNFKRFESVCLAGVFVLVLSGFCLPLFAEEQGIEYLRKQRMKMEEMLGARELELAEAPAEGTVISEIDLVGNISISDAEVFSKIRARAGETFDQISADEDAKRLAELDGVEYAYYNARVMDKTVRLTFVIVERNLIRDIVFKGNKKLSDSKLQNEIGIKKGDYMDMFLVRAGSETIKKLYREKGYAFTDIELNDEALKVGRVVYNINEGPVTKVKKLEINGNEAISDGNIKRSMKTKRRKWLVLDGTYNEDAFENDIEKLKELYQERGYLDSKIETQVEFGDDNTEVYITIDIDEGQIYILDEIVISGSDYFPAEQLLEETKLEKGNYYSTKMAEFDTNKILAKYLEAGFINANAKHTRSFPEKGKVIAEFDIDQGNRYKIGNIQVTGNQSTHDKVVRRVLDEEDFRPGQWYNADIARGDGQGELEKDLRRNVYAEGAFIKPSGDEPDIRDAIVNINEGQTGSIMVGGGVASDDGLVGHFIFDQRNFDITDWPDSLSELVTGQAFKGAGQRLRISIEPGTEYSRYAIDFTEPYLFDKPVLFNLGASNYIRGREAYDEERMKLYMVFEKRYRDDWRRGLAFRIENVSVDNVDNDAPIEIKEYDGDTMLFGARVYIGKDTTDNRYLPTRGYNFDLGYEQVSGDDTFGKVEVTQRWYKTLFEDFEGLKTVLETKLHGGYIVGDAPPFEKYYAGGTGSLRGFEYRGVSTRGRSTLAPFQKEDPIGSDWIMLANAEVSVPLGSETFAGLFFIDTGAIDTGGIRSSVGTGLQILLPQWFGPVPMRFELATPLMKDSDDETRVFSFSVGALF